MMAIATIGASSVVIPKVRVSNDDLYKDPISAKKFSRNTGIYFRRYVEKNTPTSQLAKYSVEPFLRASLYPKACVVATTSPDCPSPATAHFLHKELGLSSDIVCCDVSSSCTSALTGIIACTGFFSIGSTNLPVWLCSAEVKSQSLNPKDERLLGIFGDGSASLCLFPPDKISAEKGEGLYPIVWNTQSHLVDFISIPGGGSRLPYGKARREDFYVTMKEPRFMFSETVKVFVKSIEKIWDERTKICMSRGLCPELTPGLIFVHQANGSLISEVRKRLPELLQNKLPTFISSRGNTLSASVLTARTQYLIIQKHFHAFRLNSKNLNSCEDFFNYLCLNLKNNEFCSYGNELVFLQEMNENPSAWIQDMCEQEFINLFEVLNRNKINENDSNALSVDVWISAGGGFQTVGFLNVRGANCQSSVNNFFEL